MRILFVGLVFILLACEKKLSTDRVNDPVNNGAVLAMGSFTSGPYGKVSGRAQILQTANGWQIVLDSFMTSNGPDLYVYLSKEIMPVNFVEAGKLKSTNGTQVYPLSTLPQLSQYKYLCIHCKAYNHLFGYAELK